jgi:hypothetical protein
MIRDNLTPDSNYVAVVVTPEHVVALQYRYRANDISLDVEVNDINVPHWVRLERGAGLNIASHANDVGGVPDKWTRIGTDAELKDLPMSTPIYMGLCVTSHNSSELCTAEFSGVSMLNAPGGSSIGDPNENRDIGIPYNYPAPMYVVLKDSNSDGIVYHPDPSVTQTAAWTEWRIDLNDFIIQGVDACDVQRMYIGFGNRGNPTPGGSGEMQFDDIRLYQAEVVNLEVMAEEWLTSGIKADLIDDNIVNFKDFAVMGNVWGEQQVWPTW